LRRLSHFGNAGEIARRTPVVGKVVQRLQAPLGETMTTPRGTTPPTDYTPAEIKAYADANKIAPERGPDYRA